MNLETWSHIKEPHSTPKLDPTGALVVAVVEGTTKVWSVLSDGKLDKVIWDSTGQLPNSYCLTYEWLGTQLMLSMVDSPKPITRESISRLFSDDGEAELEALLHSRGKTLLVDVEKKEVKVVLKVAYSSLLTHPTSQRFAGVSPSHNKGPNDTIDFYEYQTDAEAKQIGSFKFAFDRRPVSLVWDNAGLGIFGLATIDVNGKIRESELVYIAIDGSYRSLLPATAQVARPIRIAYTHNNNGIRILVTYLNQTQALCIVDSREVRQRISLSFLRSILKDVALNPQVIAISPNSRFVLCQNRSDSGNGSVVVKQQDIWAVDIKTKRRCKIGGTGDVFIVSPWNSAKVLFGAWVGGEDGMMQYGIITFPAGTEFNEEEVDSIVAKAPWEDSMRQKSSASSFEPVAAAFINNYATDVVKLPTSWSKVTSPPAYLKDLSKELVAYAIGAHGDNESLIAIDVKTQRVIAFTAPSPQGPFPAQPIARSKAVDIATQFIRSYRPEYFKGGAEDSTTVQQQLTARSNFLIRFTKRSNGVLLPLWSEVEVRASDGKIAGYRELNVPVGADLTATVNREKARKILEASLPANRVVARWLEETLEIRNGEGKSPDGKVNSSAQRTVWTMVVALRDLADKQTPSSIVSTVRRIIDAKTGEILQGETVSQGLAAAHLYRSTTLDQSTESEVEFSDSTPRWSPDGKQIAFLSSRPRNGYPSWLSTRPQAVIVINADGSNPRVVANNAHTPPQWSPDGKYIAFSYYKDGLGERPQIQVVDLPAKKTLSVPAPETRRVTEVLLGWLTPRQLLIGWIHNGPGGFDLMTWDMASPDKPPALLSKDWNNQIGDEFGLRGFALDPDRKTLLIAWMTPERNLPTRVCDMALFTIPVANLKSTPKKIADCLPTSHFIQWLPEGVLAVGADKSMMVNVTTGNFAEWVLPEGVAKLSKTTSINDIAFTQNGKQIAFIALPTPDTFSNNSNIKNPHKKIRVLYVAKVDGSAIKQITSDSDDEVPSLTD